MADTRAMPSNIGDLFLALNALRRPSALFFLIVMWGLGAVAFSGGMGMYVMRSGFMSLVGFLLAMLGVVLFYLGYSAVGIRFTEELRKLEISNFLSATILALLYLPKVLIVGLLFLALVLVEFLVAAILLLLCQIPGIGPALGFVFFPLIALVLGLTLYALIFLAAPLAMAAIWEGQGIFRTVSLVITAIRTQVFDLAIRAILLGILAGVVGLVFSLIVWIGIGATAGLSLGVQLSDPNYGASPDLMFMQMMNGGGGFFRQIAGQMAGAALLFVIVGASVMLVAIYGWCLIYQGGIAQLATDDTEAMLKNYQNKARETMDKAREAAARRAAEIEQKRRDVSAAQTSQAPSPAQNLLAETTGRACGNCGNILAANVRFCTKCGTPA